MSAWVTKYASNAAVAALVIWCCWELYRKPIDLFLLEGPAALPTLRTASLHPVIPALTPRDPFQLALAPLAAPARAEEPPAEIADAPVETLDAADLLSRLTLDATIVRGDQSLALINGRPYRIGDPLDRSALLPVDCVLDRIARDHVLLEVLGSRIRLDYGNSRQASAAGNAARRLPSDREG